ncbi:CDP-glycerol glycerophosphotransferase family protein [Patescibacteria group bacterium]|nr:CDP-glycerol glycerophosphotransferase family protein [Patescibacteria group bacterium]
MYKQKRIFISSFHPLISRNILQTNILDFLLKKNYLVYIFCRDYKFDYFQKEFKKTGVKIIGIKEECFNRREKLFSQIGTYLLRTSSIILSRKERYHNDKRWLSYFLSLVIYQTIARSRFIHYLYRRLFFKYYNQNIFGRFFDEYQPDLIFATDIFHPDDIRLQTESIKHKIKTIGMVRSWDNMTNKTIMQIIPDKLIVHNETIRDEVVYFNQLSRENIYISGMPQFDYYIGYQPTPKEEFFEKSGFVLDKKIIMFAPVGKKFIDGDWTFLQILIDAINDEIIEGRPQILVRYPPGDIMDMEKVKIPGKIKVCIDKPGVSFQSNKLKDREMNKKDMVRLADSLYYSDILISAGSTLCIDIAAFDKPIILPYFDGEKNLEYFRSVVKLYDKFHFNYLVKSEAGRLVKNKDELIYWLNQYLANPAIDQEKRKTLLEEQCWQHDGLACKRILDYLNEFIKYTDSLS